MDSQITPLIESILFLSEKPLTEKELSIMLNVNIDFIRNSLQQLIDIYASELHGIQIKKVANGYCMCTKPEFGDILKNFFQSENRLSEAAIETLAIIAYNQPVTKVRVDEIRGINSEKSIQTLLEKGLIRESGRSDSPGRPILYETTDNFLRYFGLNSIKDLPDIE